MLFIHLKMCFSCDILKKANNIKTVFEPRYIELNLRLNNYISSAISLFDNVTKHIEAAV